MSRVSVIIPCFNTAPYLAQAITSVLDQMLPADEIIVVDDGSTDHSAQVAASFGSRITTIYQPNAGLAAARNTGIRAATGDYIGFLDADDLWDAAFLATLVPLLESHPQFGAVYCGTQFVDALAQPLAQVITRTLPTERLYDALIEGEFFPPCAVLVRRKILERIGQFDERLCASEDWDLWLRVAEQYPFAGTPQVLAQYRMHGNNMSRDLERIHHSQLQVLHKHFGREDADPTNWSNAKQRAFAGICMWQAMAHYQRHDEGVAVQFLQQAFAAAPKLVTRLDTFYMLGCAEQPPGYVGDVKTLNLAHNQANLMYALNHIFADPNLPPSLGERQRTAYGMAYFALGILAYRKRKIAHARRLLLRAVSKHPALILNAQWRSTFAKTLLGNHLLLTCLKWKRGLAGAASH